MKRARGGPGSGGTDDDAHSGKVRPSPARVPQTRIGRLANVALAVGELALAGLGEGARRVLADGNVASLGAGAWVSADNARRLAARLARLRGGAMKLGQMMSMQGPDLLPPEFAQALAILRAQAAPMPPAQLHRVLGREYGKGWRARFERFDEQPIAAASIGQVHRARTIDGRELALKIQYPGVARSIRGDIDNVVALLRLLKLLPRDADIDALAREAVRQLSQEADYLAEAAALGRFAALVADEPRLYAPRAHADLTTSRVLAMDFVDGEPLDALARPGVTQSVRNEIGTLLERLVFRELFEFRTMQTDPNFANYLWQPDRGRIVLLDFGSTTDFDADFVAAYTRITQAAMSGDRDAVAQYAIEIGYVDAADPVPRIEATVDVILLVCEPLRHRGRYDFAASDLPSRAGALGLDIGIRQGLLRVPPAQTMFLHRKLIGSFFLLAHIGARVDVRSLMLALLKRA
ncbi:MAG: AarF/ABC1/UbiB kinase family protein [Burkholderiaceae bacterium]|nr:AarF/ABC1/UbiB kinase family protein [Burkholderiaceae bacterium]